VEGDAGHQPDGRHEAVGAGPAAELIRVEVDAKECGPDVGHVDEQHRGDPRPFRGVVLLAVEPAEVPPDREGQERDRGAAADRGRAAERGEIDRRRKEPPAVGCREQAPLTRPVAVLRSDLSTTRRGRGGGWLVRSQRHTTSPRAFFSLTPTTWGRGPG